jgi:hypothetical protein
MFSDMVQTHVAELQRIADNVVESTNAKIIENIYVIRQMTDMITEHRNAFIE